MLENEPIIAKKYAVAYLNNYIDQYSFKEIKKLIELKKFLAKNNHFYVSLRIPNIPIKIKEEVLDKIVKEFELPSSFQKLMHLLIKDGRIEILDSVLLSIWRIYKQRNRIVSLKISSSHKLNDPDKKVIKNLITDKLLKSSNYKTALMKFKEDPSMIVGLKIESRMLLWERSIEKELMIIGKSIAKEGIPCE